MAQAAVESNPQSTPSSGQSVHPKYQDIFVNLQQQRDELLQLVTAKPLSDGIEIAVCPDLNDQATAEMDQHCMLSLMERERSLLKQIDEALTRLAGHRYGICEECGDEIPLRRLQARPMTTLCIACKTLQEEDEKIRH